MDHAGNWAERQIGTGKYRLIPAEAGRRQLIPAGNGTDAGRQQKQYQKRIYRMASEQAEEKGPANSNSSAESKQGSRRERKVLLIVIPLLLALAAAAGLAIAYRIGMQQHNRPQGAQVSRMARGSHSARGDNSSNTSASPGTEGQEGSDGGSSGRVDSSGKGTGNGVSDDNSIEDFPGTDVYKPYIPSNSPRAQKDAERGRGAGSNQHPRGNSDKDNSNNANKSNGSRPDNGAAGSGSNGSPGMAATLN